MRHISHTCHNAGVGFFSFLVPHPLSCIDRGYLSCYNIVN